MSTLECIDCKVTWKAQRAKKCVDGTFRCKKCSQRLRYRKYCKSNKGKEYLKKYYDDNRDKIVARASKWCKENRERANENVRRYSKTEKGKVVARRSQQKHYWSDPDYHRMKAVARAHGTTPDIIVKIMERDKVCRLCKTYENLTIDHVWPTIKGGKTEERNLQALCMPCNSFKGDRLFLPDGGMMVSPWQHH